MKGGVPVISQGRALPHTLVYVALEAGRIRASVELVASCEPVKMEAVGAEMLPGEFHQVFMVGEQQDLGLS